MRLGSRGESFRAASSRVTESSVPILQITAAAVVSYLIATLAFGHPYPVVALVVTISSLGLQRDARPRVVAETAIGIVMGIALSELSLIFLGSGVWQLALVLVVVLAAGRFFSASYGFAIIAAIQASMVQVLPPPTGGVFTRSLDGLVAGAVALIFTALIPRDPRRSPKRSARHLFGELNASLSSLSASLNLGDTSQAVRALERLRATQRILDGWANALEAAQSLAKISPFAHRHTDELRDLAAAQRYMDLSTRSLRLIARQSTIKLEDGLARPRLAQLVVSLTSAISLLGQSIDDPLLKVAARDNLTLLVPRLDPERAGVQDSLGDVAIVLSLRPLMVDLLCAAGMRMEDARRLIPALD